MFEWITGLMMIALMCYAIYKYTKQNRDFKI